MSTNNDELFGSINPQPRNDEESALHTKIAGAWSAAGKGEIYGIKFYTAEEEAMLRDPNYQGEPSAIDSRWVGSGPVTAMVTVAAEGIERGRDYRELQNRLAHVVPEVSVEIVPWPMQAPEGHTLAQ